MDAAESTIQRIKTTESLAIFLDRGFDAAQFATNVLETTRTTQQKQLEENGSGIEQCLSSLSENLHSVNDNIKQIVYANHHKLLEGAMHVSKLRESMSLISTSLTRVESSVARIRSNIVQPFEMMKARLRELSRMQRTHTILLYARRFIMTINKLKSQMQRIEASRKRKDSNRVGRTLVGDEWGNYVNTRELCKAAKSVSDIAKLLDQEPKLQHIKVVQVELAWRATAETQIRGFAQRALLEGLQGMNQAAVGSASQVFFNLGSLESTLTRCTTEVSRKMLMKCSRLLDMATIDQDVESNGKVIRAGGPASATRNPAKLETHDWKTAAWNRLSEMCGCIHDYTMQIWTLQRVMAKKRDPLTQVLFRDHLTKTQPEAALVQPFWFACMRELRALLAKRTKDSSFLHNLLVDDYPKAREMLQSLLDRLRASTHHPKRAHNSEQSADALTGLGFANEEVDALLGTLSDVFKEFLARVVERLKAPVMAMFREVDKSAGGQRYHHRFHTELPTVVQLKGFANIMVEELRGTRGDLGLLLAVSRGINAAVHQLVSFSEQLQATEPGATEMQLKRPRAKAVAMSPAIAHNVSIAKLLHFLDEQIETVVLKRFKGPEAADLVGASKVVEALQPSLQHIRELMRHLVQPLFSQVEQSCARVLASMHAENFGESATVTTNEGGSSFLQNLSAVVKRFVDVYMSALPRTTVISDLRQGLAERLIQLFVRHAALIRPLSEEGKLKLIQDLTQFEALVAHLFPLERLPAYKELRTLRPVLFMDTADFSSHDFYAEGVDIRPSTVLHHLFARGPPELQLPDSDVQSGLHAANHNASRIYYSHWMDSIAQRARPKADALVTTLNQIPLRSAASRELESAIWDRLQQQMDSYSQRLAATRDDSTDSKSPDDIYRLLTHIAPLLLNRFCNLCDDLCDD